MLNNLILIGRVIELPNEMKNTIKIASDKKQRDPETGIAKSDIFEIELTDKILQFALEYLNVGDLIGIKGYLETQSTLYNLFEIKIKCDTLTYLSQRKEEN